MYKLVEEKDGGPSWIQMMDRSTSTMSYQAWRRDPEVASSAIHCYCIVLVFYSPYGVVYCCFGRGGRRSTEVERFLRMRRLRW